MELRDKLSTIIAAGTLVFAAASGAQTDPETDTLPEAPAIVPAPQGGGAAPPAPDPDTDLGEAPDEGVSAPGTDVGETPQQPIPAPVATDAEGNPYPEGGPPGLYRAIIDKQSKIENNHPGSRGLTNALQRLRSNLERYLRRHGLLDETPPQDGAPQPDAGDTVEPQPEAPATETVGGDRPEKAVKVHPPAKFQRPSRPVKPDKPTGSRPEKIGRPDKPVKPLRPEKPDKTARIDRPSKPQRPPKPEKPPKPQRPDKPAKPEKPPKPDKPAKPPKPHRPNK